MLEVAAPEPRSGCDMIDGDLVCWSNDDPLTGCWSQATGTQLIDGWLSVLGERRLVVVALRVHLRRINDAHGHVAGDQVLRAIGTRLAAHPFGIYTSRQGGNEFAIPLVVVAGPDVATAVDTVREAMDLPVVLDDRTIRPALDIGWAVAPEDGSSADALLSGRAHTPLVLTGAGDGGDEGTRTPDPRDANAVLFQLSYIPTGWVAPRRPDRSRSVARDRLPARHGPSDRGRRARAARLRRCPSDSSTGLGAALAWGTLDIVTAAREPGHRQPAGHRRHAARSAPSF